MNLTIKWVHQLYTVNAIKRVLNEKTYIVWCMHWNAAAINCNLWALYIFRQLCTANADCCLLILIIILNKLQYTRLTLILLPVIEACLSVQSLRLSYSLSFPSFSLSFRSLFCLFVNLYTCIIQWQSSHMLKILSCTLLFLNMSLNLNWTHTVLVLSSQLVLLINDVDISEAIFFTTHQNMPSFFPHSSFDLVGNSTR